jgi:hypothetical protein
MHVIKVKMKQMFLNLKKFIVKLFQKKNKQKK